MLSHLALAFFIGLGLGLLLVRLGPFFSRLTLRLVRLTDALAARGLDDDAKAKLLQQRLVPMLGHLGLLMLILGLLLLWVLVPVAAYNYFSLGHFTLDFEPSAWFWVALSLGSIPPFFLPQKKRGSYSGLQKLVHRLALDNQHLADFLLRWEQKLYRKKLPVIEGPFVIVSGLARAGTTALTVYLAKSPHLCSLSYAHMPFVLSPNLWARIYKPKDKRKVERAHGDKVLFGYDSVEALEEYFWRTQLKNCYISDEALQEHTVPAEVWPRYLAYQAQVALRSGSGKGSCYLAKNNNFMLRYQSLRSQRTDFTVVLMFRQPLTHAESLMHQHRRFCQMQDDDPFVREYMDWLVHFEFGHGQRPFVFQDQLPLGSNAQPEHIDYWLVRWINYYSAVSSWLPDQQIVPVDYADFLAQPQQVLQQVGQAIGKDLSDIQTAPFEKVDHSDLQPDPNLLHQAKQIFSVLKGHSLHLTD